jgi:predicted N-acyltransferase
MKSLDEAYPAATRSVPGSTPESTPGSTPESAPSAATLQATVTESLAEVPAEAWNRLAGDDNPFLRHEFLVALERHDCVGEDAGWYPRHLLVYADDRLVGAAPMYVKTHSFGEFGSDWAWADAYQRAGMGYYPKLVCAIPFTPATGRRLLCAPGADAEGVRAAIVQAAVEIARNAGVSSLQWLFASEDDTRLLEARGHVGRIGCQYHWHNHDYRDFQDYLDHLRSKRRKQVRRERREANASDVEIRVLSGGEASEADWHAYHRLYSATYDRKWGYPSLTPEFFCEVGETMPDSVMLVLAHRDRHCVAGAHLLRGRDTLYGRNWGCTEYLPSLHFEMCYYRGIAYCIEQGLRVFEAGAQGEHKIWRGFLPRATHSAHWFRDARFRDAIVDFLRRERIEIGHHMDVMREHLPFRSDTDKARE